VVRLRSRRDDRESRARELEARSDFIRFQLKEIESASIRQDEDSEVEQELSRLEHAEELSGEAGAVHQALYAGDGAASEVLASARDRIRRLARLDPALDDLLEQLDSIYHQVVEAGRTAGSYAEKIDVSPRRAEELRQRADLLFRIKRKYGPDLSDVLEMRAKLKQELDELDESSLTLDELDRELAQARTALEDGATILTGRRTEGAAKLASEVREILPELGMPGARFEIALEPSGEPGPGGAERVEFLASLNPGFEPRALSRIASGGELSRVMLALKAILARVDEVPTLVFDEVDAGIGGKVAAGVARKLAGVAELHQVFVITHLAQVAARGARHLRVRKGEEEGLASSHVTPLAGEDRVREIARMLGGDPESVTSREHARELLSRADSGASPVSLS
jgi:DNA repair protein RecN (Recombination protein N)